MSLRSSPKRVSDAPVEPEREGGELPDGWVWARMLDILDYEGGSQPPKKVFVYEPTEGYIRLLQIRDFGEKPFPTFVPKSPRLKTATSDDLLLARYGGSSGSDSLGRICSGLDGAYNVALAKLVFDRNLIDKGFVRALFMRPWFREKVSQNSRSCQTGFNRVDVEDIWFPVAPLAEQRRIVAKLELLLAKVSSSQQRLSRIPALLERFRQSVLAAACSGRLTADWREGNGHVEIATELLERLQSERRKAWSSVHPNRKYQEPDRLEDDDLETIPDTWLWTNFDHCASEITVGHVGPMKDRYVDSGVAFLRSQNVRPLRFDPMGLVRIPKDFQAELPKSRLFGGEILVVRSGANTGDCCVFPRGMEVANCADLVITRPLSGLCAEYGAIYVASPIGQAAIGLRQTDIAQTHFNIGAMRVKPFPLPPLAEQHEIVRRVEKLFAFADQIEARLKHAQAHVDRLTQSILAKAFRGELVPTEHALAEREGREYESAEHLLARIRAAKTDERPSVSKKGRRQTRAKA